MAAVPAKPITVFFLYLTSLASLVTCSNAIELSPCFDTFVLFGQIHQFNFKEMMSYRLQLFVELGNHVWLQNVESKYYSFDLPTRNYSGMVGRLSLLASDKRGTTTLWDQPFSVQSDVGALRLDIINPGETLRTTTSFDERFQAAYDPNDAGIYINFGRTTNNMVGVARELEGRTVNGFKKLKSKRAYFKQSSMRLQQSVDDEVTCPAGSSEEFHSGLSFREKKVAGESSKTERANLQVMHESYPQAVMDFATNMRTSCLIFLMVCFTFVQLLIALLHKTILLLEVSALAGNELAVKGGLSSQNADPGAWHLCLTNSEQLNKRYVFDSESAHDLNKAIGKSSLEEAWQVAEQYLSEAIENDCKGAYFSYNCTTPQQQEVPESVLGRWNRDNAGRLIRQLWP